MNGIEENERTNEMNVRMRCREAPIFVPPDIEYRISSLTYLIDKVKRFLALCLRRMKGGRSPTEILRRHKSG